MAMKMLYGTLTKVKEENTLLFKKFTCVCRKMRFPEVIRPGRGHHYLLHHLLASHTPTHAQVVTFPLTLSGVYFFVQTFPKLCK